MNFYLGTHMPNWLGIYDVPMFVSRRRLYKRRSFPRAMRGWALDSGGFSELSMFGKWQTTAKQYAQEVRLFSQEIGNLDWAAIQDWMCEPFIIQKTGLSVYEHQRKTIDSYKTLCDLAPEIPWTPVVQGFKLGEYLRHVDMYAGEGIDLTKFPVVCLGSVCRRQHTAEAEVVIRRLSSIGIRLHGLGFKLLGLDRVSNVLHSADSMAWSFAARRSQPMPGCTHENCANCGKYALLWYKKIISRISVAASIPVQMLMPI